MQEPVHKGCHARNLPLTSYKLSRFLFSGPRFVLLNTFVSAIFFCFVECFHSFTLSTIFFCVCVLPRLTCQSIQSQLSALNLNFNFLHCFRIIDMFSANELPEISACSLLQTKIALNEFQLPLYYSYFGITEFSLSNTGFLTLYKYFIDLVMSWFVKSCKSCKSCLSFSYNLSVFFE